MTRSHGKLLLLAAAWIVVTTQPAWCQTPDAPVFEVASIRVKAPGSFMENMVRTMFGPDDYNAENATLKLLIKDAYGVNDKQIVGAPAWIDSEKYQITARIESATAYDLNKLGEDQRKLAHQHMLQALLADRFKLVIHHEVRELPVYLLVAAKNGAKLHEAKPGDSYASGLKTSAGLPVGPHMGRIALGGGNISVQGLPIASLVQSLTMQLGRLVLDKTGLTGKYDFTLEWTPENAVPEFNKMDGPSLFTALEEQLGLKLESAKGPVEVLVIDSVEHPSEN